MKLPIIPLVLMIVAGCSAGDESGNGPVSDNGNATIDAIFADYDRPGAPGCALAVTQDGVPVYSRGYGYANLDYDIPITPQTVFDVASVTKQFNAASLTMLALEGKLSLDDDVREWLPELPAHDAPVTLRHMMYHTSGLRDYLNLFPLAGRDDYYPISHAMIRAMLSRQRALAFAPGDEYAYSNTAYMLLAQVVERASGQSFGEFTEERIFGPLGMTGSGMYDDKEAIVAHRSIGYDRDDDGGYRVTHNWNFDVAGDGQLYSTMEDLLRWDHYLHGPEKPAIHDQMLVEGRLNNGDPIGYAQGLRLRDYRGLATVGHSGSSWGFRTELVRFIEPGLSIAISCNADYARPGELAQRVADHYLADLLGPVPAEDDGDDAAAAEDPLPEPLALSAAELSAFAGDYFSPELDATYRLSLTDAGLELRIEQQPPVSVAAIAEDRFEFGLHPDGWSGPSTVTLRFSRAASGAVNGFALDSSSERGIVFERR